MPVQYSDQPFDSEELSSLRNFEFFLNFERHEIA